VDNKMFLFLETETGVSMKFDCRKCVVWIY